MKDSSNSQDSQTEKFSLWLFIVTVVVTLMALLALLRYVAPNFWQQQFLASPIRGVIAFLAITAVNCVMEYFVHRYLLHTPVVPWLRRFYRQHTTHHALTRIVRRPLRGGDTVLRIENKFPIVEEEQGEASFFPWYSLAAFALALTPILAALQWCCPSFPWFFSGFLALTVSLALYEILHAINHWSFERWRPLLEHSLWRRLWRPAYAFHLRHHAVTDCNESISGFLGLPVADWIFGTCVIPRTLYAANEAWSPSDFQSPRPRWLIRWLDQQAESAVARRRATAYQRSPGLEVKGAEREPRPHSRGEETANWLTHGLGALLSLVGLGFLIAHFANRGDVWHLVSFIVFGLALVVLYAASTLYHAQRNDRARRFLQRLDHAAIYGLIAGTYTPFLLTTLRGPLGWSLFAVIWGLCMAGACLHLFRGRRHRLLSTLSYVFVGWLAIVALKPLAAQIPLGALWLLVGGGVCYTLGVPFYLWHRLRYHHAVWHTFVLGGSTCHFLAVFFFLLPARP